MPFEKFKPPKLHGVIGTQIGKANGVVLSKGISAISSSGNALRKPECPNPGELAKIEKKLANVATLSGKLSANLSAFKALPGAIKGPVSGILAVVNTIVKLPVPQAVGIPPGPAGGLIIGLPTAFTTNFADILNLMKEFAQAMLLTADAIEGCLSGVDGSVGSLGTKVSDMATPVAVCKISNTVKAKLTKSQQKELGIIDSAGNNILDSFGSKVLEEDNTTSPKTKLEKDLAKAAAISSVTLRGRKKLSDLPSSGPKLNIMKEGEAFRLPPEKIEGETINKFAVIVNSQDGKGKKKISSAGVPVKEIKIVTLDVNAKDLTGKAQAFQELDSVLKNISDKLEKTDTSENILISKNTNLPVEKKGNRLNEFDNFSRPQKIDFNSINQNKPKEVAGLESSISSIQKNLTDSIPLDLLKELKEELSGLTKNLVEKESKKQEDNEDNFYKGYLLKVQKTPESPVLAPRHFASATKNGIVVIKGPDSYSSSKEILLEEIKFKIDNQLS